MSGTVQGPSLRDAARRRYPGLIAEGLVTEPRAGVSLPGILPRIGGAAFLGPIERRGGLHVVTLWLERDGLRVLTPCFETAVAAARFRSMLAMRLGPGLGRCEGEGVGGLMGCLVDCPAGPVADVGNAAVAEVLGSWVAGGPLELDRIATRSPPFETALALDPDRRWHRVATRAGAAHVTRDCLADTHDRYHSEMSYHRGPDTDSDWYVLGSGDPSAPRCEAVVRIPGEGDLSEPEIAGRFGRNPFPPNADAFRALSAHLGRDLTPAHRVASDPGVVAYGRLREAFGD